MKKEAGNNSSGIAAVILGILSILFVSNNGIILGIIGIFFAIAQKKKNNNSWAKAGLVLSIIGVVLGILAVATIVWIAKYNPEILSNLFNQSIQGFKV